MREVSPVDRPLRILTVSALWQGANDYAFVRAFRRAGHSVSVLPDQVFIPSGWQSRPLRALRRMLMPTLVKEYTRQLIAEARHLRPDLLFIFKGTYVTAEAVDVIRSLGAIAINYYPDTGLLAHGPYIPAALPRYDWIFTTKTFGPADMRAQLGIDHASFLPHGFDPETHAPFELKKSDWTRYGCDVSFVGTRSAGKQAMLEEVQRALPDVTLRIWGSDWERTRGPLGRALERRAVRGTEYAKAILSSRVSLALLFEGNPGASSGDLITARTFEIPATGGFMLHQRTDEASAYFAEGRECEFFGDTVELVDKVRWYLGHPDARSAVAAAGRRRSLTSGYSVDARVTSVLAKYDELRARSSVVPS